MVKKVWVVASLAVLTFGWHALSSKPPQEAKDIIKFSHKFHQQEIEMTCVDCHAKSEISAAAGDNLLPDKEVCAGCHDVEDEENCQLCHYEDEETWQALPPYESDILFGHKFHVTEQNLECAACHKNLDEVDYANAESYPEMADCSSCHNNEQATLECISCHTNTLNLRPVDHTADFLMTHRRTARIDQEDCAVCHSESDCAQCHEGATLFSTTTGSQLDLQTPFAPNAGTGTKGLIITRVHDLNYRLTHGLQAVGRTQECATCHETQDFCQTCHEAEGVDVAGKPLWHSGPDWVGLPGVGGGGRHAELARRDIENCTACHSTAGDDPTCFLCHTTSGGIR